MLIYFNALSVILKREMKIMEKYLVPLLMTPPLLDVRSVPSMSISGIHNKEDTGKEAFDKSLCNLIVLYIYV